ncbi:hypothetical protein NDN08_004994 [Rhodosorus marinus]|uniref:Probable ATP-dependent transporter ycf16 n=1 Tax=Rhodosorus marinus TaxID=101924 RepID=A0AAV8UGP9_9RHOD|nr:hypothetical protein NDN08_004994 [Rhodosorus marinus]
MILRFGWSRSRYGLIRVVPRRYLSEKRGGGLGEIPAATTTQVLRNLGKYLWPEDNPQVKRRVVLSMGLLLGSKAMNVSVPFMMKHAIDSLSTVDASDAVSYAPVAFLVGYGVIRTVAAFTNELRNAVFAKVAQNAIQDVSVKTFRHVQDLDLEFHLGRNTGALARAIDRGQRGIDWVLRSMVFNVLPTIAEVTMVATVLAYKFGPVFAGLSIGTVGLYAAFTMMTTSWRTKFRKEMNKAENEAGTKSIDTLLNFETVKYFTNEDYEAKQYKKFLEKYGAAYYNTQTSLSFLNFGQNVIFSASLTMMMVLAAQGVMGGHFTVGDVVMVNGLLYNLSVPLNFLGTVYREVRQSLIDMETLFGILQVKSKTTTIANPAPLYLEPVKGSKRIGEIEFKDVSFGYTPSRRILNGLSFKVPAETSTAIVGPSGCGKSTVIRLLFRFYDPQEGTISIDGQDIRKVDLVQLRKALGIVPQDVVLFNESVMYNIGYGRVDASNEEVCSLRTLIVDAAKMAAIDSTIQSFPDGYETQVGERGLKLSGGEKQRMAIARTMLKDPKVLLCDEATSALDSTTETEILRSLRSVAAGRTSLFIAHRLSTVADSNQIIVLNGGKIVERGTHDELFRQPDGHYAAMWKLQQNS